MKQPDERAEKQLVTLLKAKKGLVPGFQVIHDAQQMNIEPDQALRIIQNLRQNSKITVYGDDFNLNQFVDATVKAR